MKQFVLTLCIGFAYASTALAGSGVVEINQARALAGGITPADTPGFPITLDISGSYALTSNLSVATNTIAILIGGTDVTLDLAGFEVAGPGTCSGSGFSLTCTLASGPSGIFVGGTRLRIRNGAVRGFGGFGISAPLGLAEHVHVHENAGGGIAASQVFDSIVERNRGDGVLAPDGLVRNCLVTSNFGAGIAGQAMIVESNAVRGNGAQGISGSYRSIVRSNNVSGNRLDGILVHLGALVEHNTSDVNGGAGISAISTANIRNNVTIGNTLAGIYMAPDAGGAPSAFSGNVVYANGGTTTSGINMGGNSCNGGTTCP